MQVHLVGGFLGSGKSTAIAMACKALAERKITAGVVTNDLGRYLVDTAFFDAQKIPAVQVTGGCLCSQYDDLLIKLDRLKRAVQPEVIFIETVGCSADLVAAVIKPLLEVRGPHDGNITFSVFADTRLLSLWASGESVPFSNKVMYLYGRQMEEAGLIVLNKRDLVSPGRARQALEDARSRFPAKQIALQNSLDPLQIDIWLDELDALSRRSTPLNSLQLEYNHYAEGRSALGWLDVNLDFTSQSISNHRPMVIDWITALEREFRQRNIGLGHLKMMVKAGKTDARVSLTTGDAAGWRAQVPDLRCREMHALVNIRAEADPTLLRELVQQTAQSAAGRAESQVEEKETEVFRPDYPKPKRRVP
ncbi:MAG: hypothetical protein GYA15_13475 [Leptolinea sp.]|jgi:G3E family GTPase|nr:hypothetical protein [Leptolinea sp.]